MSSERKPWEDEDDSAVAVAELDDVALETSNIPRGLAQSASIDSRQRLDIQKLRDDMDGLRIVSSNAATNAVVLHSLKKSRGGLMPRAGIVSVFMVSTILLARGPLQLGQEYPLVLLANIALLLGSSVELARKMTQVIWMHLTARLNKHDKSSPTAEKSNTVTTEANAGEHEEPPLF